MLTPVTVGIFKREIQTERQDSSIENILKLGLNRAGENISSFATINGTR
jgi:hypothetical protein